MGSDRAQDLSLLVEALRARSDGLNADADLFVSMISARNQSLARTLVDGAFKVNDAENSDVELAKALAGPLAGREAAS